MDDNPLTRLADIELPAPPHWHPVLWGLAAVALAAALAAAAPRLRRRMQRRRDDAGTHAALRRLDQLMGQWQLGFVDDREAGYRLAALLRLSLGMAQLDEDSPAALAAHGGHWRETVALLRRLRYERSPGATLVVEDFQRIRRWMAAALRPAQGGGGA